MTKRYAAPALGPGEFSIAEIAARTGLKPNTIEGRIYSNKRGNDLVTPLRRMRTPSPRLTALPSLPNGDALPQHPIERGRGMAVSSRAFREWARARP